MWTAPGLNPGASTFNLYMNDLSCNCNNTILFVYPDDTALYVCGGDKIETGRKFKVDPIHVHDWFKQNKLCLNKTKTRVNADHSQMPKLLE